MKRVIVTYREGEGDACKQNMMAAASSLVMEHEFALFNAFVVRATPDEIALLESLEFVQETEEDVPRYPMMYHGDMNWTVPEVKIASSSSSYTLQQSDEVPYGLGLVQAPSLWQNGIRGNGVTVCIIDSGIDASHEDLGSISGFSGQSNLPYDVDTSGHGTHVAGTIGARENNIGVVGVAPDSSLYIVRVFGDGGNFLFASGLVAAVEQCVSAGAKVINMSLGGPMSSNFENNAFGSLLSQGIIPIAAAGNDGNTQFSYPASYSNVMSVAAVDSDRRLASFSQRNSMVDIAGPGVLVRSTLPMTSPCEVCSGIGSFQYGAISGNSMATPHVAGVAALLMSFKPSASATEIQQAMLDSAFDLGTSGRDDSFGFGLVQALAAAEILNGGPLDGIGGGDGTDGDEPTPPPPTISPPSPTSASPPSPTNSPPNDGTCDPGFSLFRLDLTTDQFGSESSWVIRRNSDGATISGGNYGNEQTYEELACLNTSTECYTFTIFDSGNDGICCSFGSGSYTVTLDGDVIQTGGSFTAAEEISLGSCGRNNPVSGTCSEQGLVPIDLYLRTDSYASETSVQLVDENGELLEFADGLVSNTEYGLTECVSPSGCYNLTIFDSLGDGLSGGTEGVFVVSFDGIEQSRATSFGSQVTVKMGNGCVS
jgi:serine protease